MDGHVEFAVARLDGEHGRPVGRGGAGDAAGVEDAHVAVRAVDDLVGVAGDADPRLVGLLAHGLGHPVGPPAGRSGAVCHDERHAARFDRGHVGQADPRVHVPRDGGQFRREVADVRERALRVEIARVDHAVGGPDPLAERVGQPLGPRGDVRVADESQLHDRTYARPTEVGLAGRAKRLVRNPPQTRRLANEGVMSLAPQARAMAVTLSGDAFRRYRRFTLYNSPYVAHDRGRAVDLYPGETTGPDPVDGDPVAAPSPVAGEVVDTRTVTAPSRPYAAAEDHLILVDTGAAETPALTTDSGASPVARILHVDPAVEAGDRVAVGDSLGTLVRAGFFAPWVANHLHLGFRDPDANPYRAAGSLPLELDPAVRPETVPWDGTGTVVATGDTYAVLDSPAHPAPGERFAGVAATDARGAPVDVLDGGLPHYDGGGLLGAGNRSADTDGPVFLLGERVGTADGRDVTWADVTVRANGEPVRGLALAAGRDRLGAKLVGEGVDLPVETDVRVTIDPT